MTTALAHTTPRTHTRPGPFRIGLAAVAVLASMPYLILKAHWLLGGTVGLSNDEIATDPTMEVANLLTAGMEAVGAALAVLLIYPIGRRIPALLLQVPMFVGTGLLGGILVLVPTQLLFTSQGTESSSGGAPSGPIEPWVYTMVYGGFMLLGLSLLTIFAGYAWQRWVVPGGWTTRLAILPPALVRSRSIAVAHGVFMVAVCVVGARVMASGDLLGGHDLVAIVMALMCLAGLTALAYGRPGRVRAYVPLVMAYVGSAAVAAWGAFFFVMVAVPNPLVGDEPVPDGMLLVSALRAINGAMTLVALQRLSPLARRKVAG